VTIIVASEASCAFSPPSQRHDVCAASVAHSAADMECALPRQTKHSMLPQAYWDAYAELHHVAHAMCTVLPVKCVEIFACTAFHTNATRNICTQFARTCVTVTTEQHGYYHPMTYVWRHVLPGAGLPCYSVYNFHLTSCLTNNNVHALHCLQ
jgi:hypothetical protein